MKRLISFALVLASMLISNYRGLVSLLGVIAFALAISACIRSPAV